MLTDGPNINLCFLDFFAEKMESEELTSLIQIGICGLHTTDGSMTGGVKIIEILGKFLKQLGSY